MHVGQRHHPSGSSPPYAAFHQVTLETISIQITYLQPKSGETLERGGRMGVDNFKRPLDSFFVLVTVVALKIHGVGWNRACGSPAVVNHWRDQDASVS